LVVFRPVLGSVTPKQALSCPAISGGSQRAFCCIGAEHHGRMQAEDVHVHRRRARQPGAGGGDGVHHERRFGDAQAGAADIPRHRDAQPAGLASA
jgi:hypothetical protein